MRDPYPFCLKAFFRLLKHIQEELEHSEETKEALKILQEKQSALEAKQKELSKAWTLKKTFFKKDREPLKNIKDREPLKKP